MGLAKLLDNAFPSDEAGSSRWLPKLLVETDLSGKCTGRSLQGMDKLLSDARRFGRCTGGSPSELAKSLAGACLFGGRLEHAPSDRLLVDPCSSGSKGPACSSDKPMVAADDCILGALNGSGKGVIDSGSLAKSLLDVCLRGCLEGTCCRLAKLPVEACLFLDLFGGTLTMMGKVNCCWYCEQLSVG